VGAKIESKRVIVTGGAGYIGSHICIELIKKGYAPIIVDNFSNSPVSNIDILESLTGVHPKVYDVDVTRNLSNVFKLSNIIGVIHLAGLKSDELSREKPVEYMRVNVGGTINVLEHMKMAGTKNILFPSTAKVYSDSNQPPFTETMPVSAKTPYISSKLICEEIIQVACKFKGIKAIAFRNFNPINYAGKGFTSQENFSIFPTMEFSAKERRIMSIFGNDYPTPDGTCIRDYIHVNDLAAAYVSGLEYLISSEPGTFELINLGTGTGISVLQLISDFEKSKKTTVFREFAPPRPDSLPSSFADISKALKLLNWSPKHNIL
jgi:UDP-glucose 4-epimerase